ncbi:uncharacterized protein LOC141649295 [Silene latifolia]|uniref:uncharacterized protein LOC141649295 n=1 Tax=Silene latifolia TaxID=37657 RepID=UPI003D76BE95
MEYLRRILDNMTSTMPFKFNPLCGQLKLSHLLFADDLLLFSKVKADIIEVSGFVEGGLPLKYLGVPIVTSRLSLKHCVVLIDNVTSKIRGFGARKLSYSGRLTLVNVIPTSLYSYWANIFVIPKGVLRRIDAIGRTVYGIALQNI